MSRLRRSARAEADLLDIWHHVAIDNPDGATKLLRRIDEVCRRLETHPEIGARRDDAMPGLRIFPVGRYLVVYRLDVSDIEILRILHGARQWQDLL